jgi:hypothetical protein
MNDQHPNGTVIDRSRSVLYVTSYGSNPVAELGRRQRTLRICQFVIDFPDSVSSARDLYP